MTTPAKARNVDLSELQELWQLSFQRTTRGISVSDAETGQMLAVNPSFARMHGGEPEDFLGRRLSEFLSPACAVTIPGVIAELEREGFAAFEAEHVRLDGSHFPVTTELSTAADPDGQPRYRIGWFTDVSERSLERRRRREAERRFETAFAEAAAGMALLGVDGRWLQANTAFCEITGYQEGELRGLGAEEMTHPDDREASAEWAAKLLIGEVDGYQLEQRYLRRGGAPVWVLTAVSLLRDEDGDPVHYIVHAYDISLRKRMQEDLAGAAPGSAPPRELMCTLTLDGRLDVVRGDWREALGWSPEELRSRELIELVHPDDREEIARELRLTGEGGGEWRAFRGRWRNRDGGWSWLAWSTFAMPDRGRIYCSVREASERVSVESAADLRGAVIASMAEGVCLVTMSDMRIVYANRSLERMLGYGPEDLTGQPAREALVPPDLSAAEERERARAERELFERGSATHEGRRRRRDGSSLWCRTTTTRFDHSRYGPVWVAVHEDMTDERRAREAAERLERAKTGFIGSVSQELRTPLTSILGHTALLRQDVGGQGGEVDEHLAAIECDAGRELRLVEDLLSVARIEAGEFEIHRQPTDLEQAVRLAVDGLQPAAEGAALRLTLESAGPVPVRGDADRLTQVVANLVSNAIEFTPAGGAVGVSLSREEGRAVVRVADTGPGVRAEERSRLFERMFRGEEVRQPQIDGAGLGLSIARSIVEAHEGTIEVRAAKSGGAVFEVSLPLPARLTG